MHEELKTNKLSMNDLSTRVLAKGYKLPDLEKCIQEYSKLAIWNFNTAANNLEFL